jgi:hypothetical protein
MPWKCRKPFKHEAIAAGWKDFAHMQKDPDLTVLRDLPEFKSLLPRTDPDEKK